MIPSQVGGRENNSTQAERPKLTGGAQWAVTLVTILVCLPIILLAVALPSILENAQCPISTFYRHWIFMGSAATIFGVITIAICPSLILAGGASALGLLRYEAPYEPSPFARRVCLRVVAVAFLSLAAGWAALMDEADRFFCLSTDGIMVRRGWRDVAHQYSWSDVQTIYVSCVISRPTRNAPFQAADFSLQLSNGQQLIVGLRGSDGRALMNLKASLNNVDYKFYVNRTVTPEYCPAELYEHIWNWLNE